MVRYFEWMGAAHYTADRRSGAMHGKIFLLDSIYAGIDDQNLYGRVDFVDAIPDGEFEITVNIESWAENSNRVRRALRLNVAIANAAIVNWSVSDNGDTFADRQDSAVALAKNFEFKLPLAWLYAAPVHSPDEASLAARKLRVRFSVWQNRLPADALPIEGWMELQLLPEEELIALAQ
jgi:hypothetical protein